MPTPCPNNRSPGNTAVPAARPKLVVIAGPTAVGKTTAGAALARRFDGEVISADSRYLYRGLDIGVAKPSAAEHQGVPHHLIDIADPNQTLSLATVQELAIAAILGTSERGRLPFLVGGTPLYINAIVEGWRIPRVPPNHVLRADLEAAIARDGIAPVSLRLAAIDPVAASRAARNPRRIIRALEIYAATGIAMSELEGKGPPPFHCLELGLTMPRDQLYRAIDQRVDDQVARGLVSEVQQLLARGVPPEAPAMSSLGYRQLLPHLNGDETLSQAVARIKTDTHRYVRHQETWLRRNPRLLRIDVTEPGWLDRAAVMISRFLKDEPAQTPTL